MDRPDLVPWIAIRDVISTEVAQSYRATRVERPLYFVFASTTLVLYSNSKAAIGLGVSLPDFRPD
jgi:hypothetical protein